MLNYIWLGLIVFGIGMALTTDISDEINNKYNSGNPIFAAIQTEQNAQLDSNKFNVKILIKKSTFNSFFKTKIVKDFVFPAVLTLDSLNNDYLFYAILPKGNIPQKYECTVLCFFS